MVDGQSASPKNQVPPISSLNGELGSDAPTQMETTARKPKSAGRRRKDQSSGSPGLGLDALGERDAAGEAELQGVGPHGEAAEARADPVEDRG